MVTTRSGLNTNTTTIPDGSEIPTGSCIICGKAFRVGASVYGHAECCDTFLTLTEQGSVNPPYVHYGVPANIVNVSVENTEHVFQTYQLPVPAQISSVEQWIQDKWYEICDYSGLDVDTRIHLIY